MEIEVSSNYTPYHDFQYQIRGVAGTFTTRNYDGHMSGTNHNTITDIIPTSYGSFADSVGVIDSLRFFWVATKIGFGFDTGDIITISGPHTIFLTYDKPLLDTVNVLALDNICHYAQDEYIDTVIAKSGVDSVYGEGWAYDPNHHIFDDPLDVIRKKTGQCADYANLLVYLYEAVGIQSNAVVIFNAAQSGNLYYLTWWNLETNNRYANIYSNLLTSCDGTTKYWDFTYHVVAVCPEHYCEAALGLFRKTSDYSSWWRYYVYPQALLPNPDDYLDAEPPPVEPYYYNRSIYAIPPIFPTGLLEYDTYHRHRHP